MKLEHVTVLDLGSTKVTCLAARSDGEGGIEVRAVEATPCKAFQRASVGDLDEAARAIDLVVRRVAHSLPPDSIGNLMVGIGGPGVEGVTSQGMKPIVPRGRQITYQDILEVINHSRSVPPAPDREQIQALPREFRVDAQRDVHNAVGMTGAKLEVETYLVTAPVAAIQSIERAIAMCGRKVDQFVLHALASGLGVLTPEERDLGAIVIDIGGGITNIAIFSHGSLAFSASIPVGSRHVTTDLAHLLKTSVEEAERLKTFHGCALASLVSERESVDVLQIDHEVPRPLQRRVLCEIIEARLREIASLVAKQVAKGEQGTGDGERVAANSITPSLHHSTTPSPSPAPLFTVFLTGGGALLPGTEKLFEEVLGVAKVRTREPLPVLGLPSSPGLAASVGLARFAIECYDELSPASGIQNWRDKVRSLFSLVTGG